MIHMQYFIAVKGQQQGPFDEAELASRITPDTLVWREGMPEWKRASEVAELAAVLAGGAGNVGGNQPPQPQQSPPQQARPQASMGGQPQAAQPQAASPQYGYGGRAPNPQQPQYPQQQQFAQQQYMPQNPAYGQPNPYAQPVAYAQPYGGYVSQRKTNGMCVAGMICGIVSLVCMLGGPYTFILAILLAIVGVTLGAIGKSQATKAGEGGAGMGIAGIVCGSICLGLYVLILIFFFSFMAAVLS